MTVLDDFYDAADLTYGSGERTGTVDKMPEGRVSGRGHEVVDRVAV